MKKLANKEVTSKAGCSPECRLGSDDSVAALPANRGQSRED